MNVRERERLANTRNLALSDKNDHVSIIQVFFIRMRYCPRSAKIFIALTGHTISQARHSKHFSGEIISRNPFPSLLLFGFEMRISAGQLLVHFQHKIQRSLFISIFGGILSYLIS